MDAMEERITHSATSFGDVDSSTYAPSKSSTARFERPSALEISLCCEISAYVPDGDDRPLF
jgi:hypothetical protein